MRNTVEIYVWMKRNGLSVTQLQRILQFASHSLVSRTIAGSRHNRKVLRLLLTKGCPVKYLDLPKDIKEAA